MKGASKALLFGSAAGLGYGLQAAVTKTFVGELGHGALSLLADWSVYVLVISAVIGFVLQQGALKTGVLAPAMASSNAVTLFSSVTLGIIVYGERLSASGGGHVASAAVGLVVAIVGIMLLGSAEVPPDERRLRSAGPRRLLPLRRDVVAGAGSARHLNGSGRQAGEQWRLP